MSFEYKLAGHLCDEDILVRWDCKTKSSMTEIDRGT